MSSRPPIPPSRRQKDVLDFIHRFLAVHGYPPTRPEIGAGTGRTRQNCNENILALMRKGWLEADFGTPRGLRLLHAGDAPIVDGTTPLGSDRPVRGDERIVDRAPRTIVDAFTARPNFFLTSDGQQVPIDVEPGDLLAVRAATEAEDGAVVIGRTGEQIVCRRLGRTRNDDAEPLRIEGVVVGSVSARVLTRKSGAPADTPGSTPRLPSPRQHEVLECIAESIRRRGYPPSRGEMARTMKTPEQAVDIHIKALVRKGWLAVDHNTIRGFRLTRTGSVPVIDARHRVPAGEPVGHEKRIVDRAPATLADRFAPRPDFFARVEDPHGAIDLGAPDLLAVQAATTTEPGTVVIGRIGNRVVCRRAGAADTDEPAELRVEGTVVGVLATRMSEG